MDLTKIYGIEFDEAVPQGGEKRICDAQGMINDYVIGSVFQLNHGQNDFDRAYPFGSIRTCNVAFRDGIRNITYENEPGFSRTGENGNVMVEIPKFYSKREKIGTLERWMISGTKYPGFETEPVFIRGGKELDAVYVGVYNTQCRGNGLFSTAGGSPDVCKTAASYRETFAQAGYDPYDLAVNMCLQRLSLIEFGTRRIGMHLGGIGFLRYFNRLTSNLAIKAMAPGRITIEAGSRGAFFAPGHEIGVGHIEHDPNYIHRTVTKVARNPENPDWVDIDYARDDLQGIVAPETDAAFGIPQKNGLSDGLSYHTGRGDLHCLDPEKDNLINAFRYRGIENPWGNIWEYLEGLRIRALHYRYTFDPELYAEDSSKWKQASFCAPCQPNLGGKATNLWVDSMGFDPQDPLLLLPQHSTGNDKQVYTYYCGGIFTFLDQNYSGQPVDPNTEYRFTVGAGYDARTLNCPFTYRGFLKENVANWLYCSRVCLRR